MRGVRDPDYLLVIDGALNVLRNLRGDGKTDE
jgi:hypothetical protein